MFFVDYDNTQIFHRRKHRRPCADNDSCLAEAYPPPFVKTFTVAQMAVQNGNIVSESAPESVRCLRCQRYFRDKNNCAAAVFKHVRNCLHINFGLSAPRDTVKKQTASGIGGFDFFKCVLLRRKKRQRLRRLNISVCKRISIGFAPLFNKNALFNKCGNSCARTGHERIYIACGKLRSAR